MDSPGHEKIAHSRSQHELHLQSLSLNSLQNRRIPDETVIQRERSEKGDPTSSLLQTKIEESVHLFEMKGSRKSPILHDTTQSQRKDKNRVDIQTNMNQSGVVKEDAACHNEVDCHPLGRNTSLEHNSSQDSEPSGMDVDDEEGKPSSNHLDNSLAKRGPAIHVTDTPKGTTNQNLMDKHMSLRNVEIDSDDQQLRPQEHGQSEAESLHSQRSKGSNPLHPSIPRGSDKLGPLMLKEESQTVVHKDLTQESATQKQRKELKDQRNPRSHIYEIEMLKSEKCHLHNDLLRAVSYIREMEFSVQKYRQHVNYQHHRLQQLEQEKQSLYQQIEKFELQNAQQSVAETGSYEDLTATPPLLQTAVDAAKEAVGIFASDIFKEMKMHAISMTSSHADLGTEMKPAQTKILLQSEICTAFFTGFENQSFGISTAMLSSFARPKEQKQKFYKQFQDLRYAELPQIYKQDDFHQFLDMKRGNFVDQAQSLVFTDARQRVQFLCNIIDEEKPAIFGSFVRLGKAIWVLHKLAFAFEPTAEIFRVTKNSLFDEDYMKKISQDVDEEDEEGASEREVAFMVVPGFTVRNTVVKAHVCLKPPPLPLPKPTIYSLIKSVIVGGG